MLNWSHNIRNLFIYFEEKNYEKDFLKEKALNAKNYLLFLLYDIFLLFFISYLILSNLFIINYQFVIKKFKIW